MASSDSCGECGVPAAPRSCGELFQELLARDHARQPPWGPLHGVSVSCFLLQHPGRLPADGGAMAWALLHAYLAGGLDAVNPLVGRARRANSHRVGGAPSPVVRGPEMPHGYAPPSRFSCTIEDVAVDGTFPAEGFAERVRAWAAATVDAWSRGA
ncbi:DUF5946 family protein [Streptomyces palmae]|uniref:Uncharacterized protein n=1 Tax=Streptomyces palmae TaxID=1701085 RepID=A0A4Z0H8J0_9ACTN|nr:DUF5946 family protein [Streptomyces palmae]TGB12665.1 hypothetical protein E4099_11005 [Streptomyces palmae]